MEGIGNSCSGERVGRLLQIGMRDGGRRMWRG